MAGPAAGWRVLLDPLEQRKNQQRLAAAYACLQRGLLAGADVLCRVVLDSEPDSREAWTFLATIAGRLEQAEKQREYARRADGAPDVEPSAARAAGQPARGRYLLIKSWNHGFWSEVSHILGGLLLAEMTGREPVVHWGRGCRFGDATGRNAFELYFAPVSPATVDDLSALATARFFPAGRNRGNLLADGPGGLGAAGQGAIDLLGRPEEVAVAEGFLSVADLYPWITPSHPLAGRPLIEVYRYLVRKYLTPVPAVTEAAERFVAKAFGAAPFVAAHLRGTDKILEDGALPLHVERIIDLLDAAPRSTPLFVMTDDRDIAARAADRLGSRMTMTDALRTGGEVGLHFQPRAPSARLGLEVMTDVYIALRASSFIGIGQSNVSSMIAVLKEWPDGSVQLFGYPVLFLRSGVLYLPPEHHRLLA